MRLALASLALLLATGCISVSSTEAPPAPAPAPGFDLTTARVVDLSHSFDKDTIYWPTSPSGFELKELSHAVTPGGWFYASNSFCTPEHGGTHLDAPIHFAEGKWTSDQIPVDRLVGPAVVIDIRDKAGLTDYRLTAADVRAWEKRNGTIKPGSIVILRTGWFARWPDKLRYLGDDTPGVVTNLHFPSYGEAAARLLVSERRVSVIGVDTASIDYGQSKDFIVHRVAMAENVIGLENLANLDVLPERGAWIVALPMKIAGGSGGPLRAIALLP
jgi:kynurenine formamidase